MSKYYIAMLLYICGMLATIFQAVTSENDMKYIQKEIMSGMPFSKKTNCAILVVSMIIYSVIWPISWFKDVIKFIKRKGL